jgi:hypothetical protein
MELTSEKSRRQIFMKLTIEFEQTKITLSVGSEGVTIDAPDPVEEETRQTTLSEAQWAAYAQGREDEREEHECEMCGFRKNEDLGPIEPLGDIIGENNLPPKVDPVTGDIAGWVKTYRTERRKRALEAQPRAVCVSTCCGTEGARTRDGSCWGCR